MRKIETLQDLKVERARLRAKLSLLESDIKNDFEGIKESLKPVHILSNAVGKMFATKNYGVLEIATSSVVSSFLRKVLFRNAGLITRLILPFFAKNITANMVTENKTKIVDWVLNLYSKWKHKHNHQPVYDKTTADTNL